MRLIFHQHEPGRHILQGPVCTTNPLRDVGTCLSKQPVYILPARDSRRRRPEKRSGETTSNEVLYLVIPQVPFSVLTFAAAHRCCYFCFVPSLLPSGGIVVVIRRRRRLPSCLSPTSPSLLFSVTIRSVVAVIHDRRPLPSPCIHATHPKVPSRESVIQHLTGETWGSHDAGGTSQSTGRREIVQTRRAVRNTNQQRQQQQKRTHLSTETIRFL